MAQCTAPIRGHRTASGAANCPACGGRSYGYSPNYLQYLEIPQASISKVSLSSTRSISGSTRRPRWSPPSSTASYTAEEVRALTPIRISIEQRSNQGDRYDIFLCHAWDDRREIAVDLNKALEQAGVSVWFSEKNLQLGTNMMREIDRGLAKSRAGIVLVTANFIKRIQAEGVADKELSALLARDLLVPIVHGITYDDLREESPLLASRSGLDTATDTIDQIANKIRELVSTEAFDT